MNLHKKISPSHVKVNNKIYVIVNDMFCFVFNSLKAGFH